MPPDFVITNHILTEMQRDYDLSNGNLQVLDRFDEFRKDAPEEYEAALISVLKYHPNSKEAKSFLTKKGVALD